MADISTAPKIITCEECRELLSAYVDRETGEDIRLCIERHLTECTRCITESTRLQGLKNIIRHWDGVKGTGKFRTSVMQQMIRESQQMQIPAERLAQAEADARNARQTQPQNEAPDEPKRLPPVWVLIVAIMLAAIVYFVVLRMRGM